MVKISKKMMEDLLEKSTKVRTDVSTIVLDVDPLDFTELIGRLENEIRKKRVIQIALGEHMVSLICDDPLALRLSKEQKRYVISYKKDLASITLSSPKKAVDTPGILAYIFMKFAEKNINIVEVLSCHNDVSFIIKRDDALRARELLGKIV